jgi:hypothetical protein
VSVLRLPPGAPALRPQAGEVRIEADDRGVIAIGTAAVLAGKGGPAGAVAVASRVDLGAAHAQFVQDSVGASLVGLARPIELAPVAGTGTPIDLPVPVESGIRSAPLVVQATIRPIERGRTFRAAGHAAFGASIVLLLGFATLKKRVR